MIKAKPSLYGGGRNPKYKEEYNQFALDFLAQGKSCVQLASTLNIHRDTLLNWAKNYPDFADAVKLGKQKSQGFWEDELVSMMYDKNVNAPLVKLYFANRFGWSDKKEIDNTSTDGSMQPITINIKQEKIENVIDVESIEKIEND